MGFGFIRQHILPSVIAAISVVILVGTKVNDIWTLYNLGLTSNQWELIGLLGILFAIGTVLFRWWRAQQDVSASSAPTQAERRTDGHYSAGGHLVFAGGNVSINEPALPVAAVAAATKPTFQNEELYIWELAPKGDFAVKRRIFKNCIFYGPAVVTFMGCNINGLDFETRHPEDALIEVAEGRMVIGVFAFVDCDFQDCKFKSIAIIGSPSIMAAFRRALRK